jgi:hypothetical protein
VKTYDIDSYFSRGSSWLAPNAPGECTVRSIPYALQFVQIFHERGIAV